MARPGGETPEFLACPGVQGEKLPFRIAGEHQPSRRRKNGSQERIPGLVTPHAFPADRIVGVEMAAGLAIGRRLEREHSAEEVLAFTRLLFAGSHILAPFMTGRVIPARNRREGSVIPAPAARDAWADGRRLPQFRLVSAQ